MHQKWKYIIANWINCYFYENDNKNVVPVNYESLLNIISHLRENFNLDESKSSIFSGRSLEEFISEKYPSFKFQNGTVEVTNEEEIYIAASLLLFFVCVNSKDVDIKSAMCSKLSTGDQEVILKYSKSLMECDSISANDVIAAITEACGPDVATGEGGCSGRVMVAETPPALRSLHGEVRRLQAALDAERFDKNYLQDELARTNLKLERLLRDKEQYRADIMDLRAKISMCCGQEAETRGDESKSNEIAKLSKQLQQMEERVVDLQEQLDEVQHERNTYRTKLEDLKGERDRLIVLNQEETIRASQLIEALEMEKRQGQTLRELVIELRQHNHRNGLDTSLLECDDPDTSVQSLQRSFSVCSEVCANVVEVQLGEERAKSLALKQQIQSLQDEMRDLVQKADIMQQIITDRENDICNLKHRINEEIEEKNNMKSYFENEVTKLNNIVNELEQKLKDNNKHSSLVIQNKMQDIKTLQEEKLSLLQSLSNETAKSENTIKDLKTEIDTEKTSRMKMREDYENLVMEMKEKVLNRNNELVELQNNILQKSELIQQLNFELRDEKKLKEKMINQYNNDIELLNAQKGIIEKDYNVKLQEVSILQDTINEWKSKKDIADTSLRKENKAVQEKLLELTNNNSKFLKELEQKVIIITNLEKELSGCEKMITSLEADRVSNQILFAEFDCKNNELQDKNKMLENERDKLTAERNQFGSELSVLHKDMQELNNKLIHLKENNSELLSDIDKKQLDITQLEQQIELERNHRVATIEAFENEKLKLVSIYNLLQEKHSTTVKELEDKNKELIKYQEILNNNNNLINDLEKENTEGKKLFSGLKLEKEVLESEKDCLIKEQNSNLMRINQLEEQVKHLRYVEIPKLKEDNIHLINIVQENKIVIGNLEKSIVNEKEESKNFREVSETQKINLTNKINLLEEVISKAEHNLEDRNLEVNDLRKVIDTLKSEAQCFEEDLKFNITKLNEINKEKDLKLHELTQELEKQVTIVLQNQKEIESKELAICELKEKVAVIEDLTTKLEDIKNENEQYVENLRNKEQDIANLEKSIAYEKEESNKLRQSSESQKIYLINKINLLEENLNKVDRALEDRNLEVNELKKVIDALKFEAKLCEDDLKLNNVKLIELNKEKDIKIHELIQELEKQRALVIHNQKEIESKEFTICELKDRVEDVTKELDATKKENEQFVKDLRSKEEVIANLEQGIVNEKEECNKLRQSSNSEKINLTNQINVLEENINKAERALEERNLKVNELKEVIEVLTSKAKFCEEELRLSNVKLIKLNEEKDVKLQDLTQELETQAATLLQNEKEIQSKEFTIGQLKERVNAIEGVMKELEVIKKENEQFVENLRSKDLVIFDLKKSIVNEKEQSNKVRESSDSQKINLTNKINFLEEDLNKAEYTLKDRNLEVNELKKVIEVLKSEAKLCKDDLKLNNEKLIEINKEKDFKLHEMTQKLEKQSAIVTQNQKEIDTRELIIRELKERVSLIEDITNQIEVLKKENEQFVEIVRSKEQVIANLEESIVQIKDDSDKLRESNDSQKKNLTNKIIILEENLNKAERSLEERILEVNELKKVIEVLRSDARVCEEDLKLNNEKLIELTHELEKQRVAVLQNQKDIECKEFTICELKEKVSVIEDVTKELEGIKRENQLVVENLESKEQECALLQRESDEWKIKKDTLEVEFESEKNVLQEMLTLQIENNHKLEKYAQSQFEIATELQEKIQAQNITISNLQSDKVIQEKVLKDLENEIVLLKEEKVAIDREKSLLINEKNDILTRLNVLQTELDFIKKNTMTQLTEENLRLTDIVERNKTTISTLEKLVKKELEQNELLRKENSAEKLELIQKYNALQENQQRVEQEISQKNIEVNDLKKEILKTKSEFAIQEDHLKEVNRKLTNVIEEKEELISKINDELSKEIALKDQYRQEAESKENAFRELQNVPKEESNAMLEVLMNENKMLTKQIAQIESNAAQEKFLTQQNDGHPEKNQDVLHPQVDCISSTNISHLSMDSNKTIRDLEKILNDKNRTITSLQVDITFLKSLMAESENKVLDLSKDLEASQENCQQLSNQLKKILYQKNEEIAELKSKISKVSAMENRASQIIKVSAKYQEIIHKRMAEIKSNTVLKELTNFGNHANCDSDLKRGLNSGTITMEDLENFLESTERHIRRCSEKRAALQKERDRLVEVNRINESEIISLRKFLAELSVGVKTFNSVKEIYAQRLSRVVSLQRTVRRDLLSAEARLTEAAACRLERGYAAAMQDLAECAMNLERWVERSIGWAISAEKMKQAFAGDDGRASLAPATFQNASLEAQMEQLQNSFQKLLEEAARAQKGDGAKDALSLTVQEVRAEYEEKLARMKTKMKEIYQKEVQSFKEAQREEVTMLQQKLQSTRDTLTQARKDYEEQIRSMSLELWTMGEKFLDKADEADWLRRKQRSESLMSLQHVPSSGYCTQPEEPGRPSDTHSLRSLPVNINKKREGRGLHMSDEEGEVFDNRCLRELSTPLAPRLSELRWRNSLCLPHLKSSYPAETQFAPALHEDDIKAGPTNASIGVRQQRKEVGITAYKKPGPPTPSKQAGRLSATDSELRESLRVEAEPQARKTATPSRLRSLFSSARNDTVEGTPRSRRLSNFFRKK